jgi:hypothetical protein
MNGSPYKSPASYVGRGLTEKGASPALPIPNHNETATDALGRRLAGQFRVFLQLHR